MRRCRALLISAPASNQGKTTITAGIAYSHKRRGQKVRVFKTGPDFLDPMILERASGNPVYQLDLWMNGEDDCRQLLYEAACQSDLILVEGVMGLFDGKPSSADLAECFGIPVVVVIDAGSMAQTFAAVGQGMASFRPSLPFAGVLANNVASERHAKMIEEVIPNTANFLGTVFRNNEIAFPSRHLGLVQAGEIADIDQRLIKAANAMESTTIGDVLQDVDFHPGPNPAPESLLDGVTIAVAKDAAFSFLYEANLRLLQNMGARISFFSPLQDKRLPKTDSVYLPGGYPELYLDQLENNLDMKNSLHEHYQAGKSIYAECGGMLYLLESLKDKNGKEAKMAGLLPGKAVMQPRLASLGYQSAELPNGTLRGHTFHYSSIDVNLEPICFGKRLYDASPGEPIYRSKGLFASYLHLYFPSNPTAIAPVFNS
ncbi:MAG: cobyrinate a,c-diamide synthase [Candidatus Melainabacteria bacterium]|nr:MAG: cobyrinate a,c-diamide synthase [Candidatus Melainabacteria bacterium]